MENLVPELYDGVRVVFIPYEAMLRDLIVQLVMPSDHAFLDVMRYEKQCRTLRCSCIVGLIRERFR